MNTLRAMGGANLSACVSDGRRLWQVHVPCSECVLVCVHLSVCRPCTVARLSVQLAGGSRLEHFGRVCLFVPELRV